ncbi:hypothetical protein J4573_18995 [Actinomadura barringtoniae]|uniref:Uncharacterized protein n=1 Tax=Actinomadura barringtoniae TaxID=1427535 RepID=A0A939T580_9ACTN|nr:hypothetical protein [Actinomadura barringtoniae]MBO2449199.1 hypothetical protein [Actinomadura barringtoniae]
MNGHDAHTHGAGEAGRGRTRRRLVLVTLLLGMVAAGAAIPAPESPLSNLTGTKTTHASESP